ncbi:MAG: hypothetical protein ABI670_08870 [Chloroflexota bacterium]
MSSLSETAVRVPGTKPQIDAEAHSDDWAIQVKFDAAPYLAQASPDDIKELAECGWGGRLSCQLRGHGQEPAVSM